MLRCPGVEKVLFLNAHVPIVIFIQRTTQKWGPLQLTKFQRSTKEALLHFLLFPYAWEGKLSELYSALHLSNG